MLVEHKLPPEDDFQKQEELPELDDEDLPLPPAAKKIEDLPIPPLPVKDLPLPSLAAEEIEDLPLPPLAKEVAPSPIEDLPLPPAPEERPPDDEHSPDDVQKPLEEARSLLDRGRDVSDDLFKQTYNMPEWKRMLATPERHAQFESKLLAKARSINSRLGTDLPDTALNEVVNRLANSIAAWEHSPERQRERQRKQAAKRRRRNLGRDLQIVRLHESGESQRRIADRFDISRGAVRNVLHRARRDKTG